jgi:hypothetical protein
MAWQAVVDLPGSNGDHTASDPHVVTAAIKKFFNTAAYNADSVPVM